MKIRTQLIAAIIIFALLLVFVSGFVLTTNQHVDSLTRQEELANGIAIQVAELGYLSNDYILYREPQLAEQWNIKYESISNDITKFPIDQPEQRPIVTSLSSNLRNIKAVFDEIPSDPVQSGIPGIGSVQISLGRMAVLSQGMIFDASRLSTLISAENDRVRETRLVLILTLMGTFGAVLLSGYFLIYRRTLKSISDLAEGARIVGSGNLQHQIDVKGENEISDLSRSFNRMTTSLRQVIATKTELEEEIAGRKKAEDELVRVNVQLSRSEQNLIRQNVDLNALNEELTATQEELKQNVDDISRSEEILRQNEDRLKHALAEKEILLSEIHHRVKNNLTAFISLLSLEGSIEETPAGRQLKLDLQNRARSMALVHETLYRTHLYNDVDMEMYLTTLLDQIATSFQTTRPVKTMIDAHGVMLDIPRATPAGLIINELVTNSFKYAFPESFDVQAVRNAPPIISITLTKTEGMYELIVSDNGAGMPAGFDLATTQTLGLKLVNFLAKHQLRAKIGVAAGNGTEFTFRFKA